MPKKREETSKPARDKKGRWKKGCASPNPKGGKPGPRGEAARTIIERYCSKKNKVGPIEFLCQVLNSKKEKMSLRIDCAKYLSDRLYGKPINPIDLDADKIEIKIKRKNAN